MERLLNQFRHNGHRLLAGGAISLIFIFLLAGSYFRWLEFYELDTLDIRFRLRPAILVTNQVAMIEIGDDTIAQLGHFPIERSNHATLIKALADAGAKAIIFDIFFSEPGPDDEALSRAIEEAGNVYLPYAFSDSKKQGNVIAASRFAFQSLPDFTEYAQGTGHINITPDRDGKWRRVPLVIEYENSFHPYISFLVGCRILGISFEGLTIRPGQYISYGNDFRWPLDENSTAVINYAGPWGQSYAHYSYVDVLRSYIARITGEKPLLDLSVFKDKICIIGLTAEGTWDLHSNPYEALYPSVGIHAEVINAMVNEAFIARASRLVNMTVLIALIGLTAWIVWTLKPLKAFLYLLSMATVFTLLAIVLFSYFGLWIDLFYPLVIILSVYLLNTIWQLVLELKNRLIMENELKIARQIQESFLPKAMPQTSRLDIAARMLTARQVGGDLYDCFPYDDGCLGVMIGDVSGKGIPASLFMAMVVGAFKFYAASAMAPEETLRLLNEKLMKEAPSGLFVTMYYAVFDFRQGTMIYANGGHLPVLRVPQNCSAQFLDVEDGLPLGMIQGEYSKGQTAFTKGDLFVFYTDGITEAKGGAQEMYGKERFQALVEKHRGRPVEELMQIIEDDVRRFEPVQTQHDDITYIVLKVI